MMKMKTECPKCKEKTFVFNTPMTYPYSNDLSKFRYVCENCGHYEWVGLLMKTEYILNEREKTHGDYNNVAMMTQEFDAVFGVAEFMKLDKTNSPQKLAIRMIFLKIARIICGDPNHADHWDDIAGYAMLGKGKEEPTEFEKEYCVRLDGDKGVIHFWKESGPYHKDCERCSHDIKHACQKHLKEYIEKEDGDKRCEHTNIETWHASKLDLSTTFLPDLFKKCTFVVCKDCGLIRKMIT